MTLLFFIGLYFLSSCCHAKNVDKINKLRVKITIYTLHMGSHKKILNGSAINKGLAIKKKIFFLFVKEVPNAIKL